MIQNATSLYLALSLSIIALLFAGCDLFGSEDEAPEVDEVIVVGTDVDANFQNTGSFGLSATPLDQGGNAILAEDLDGEVTLRHEGTASGSNRAKAHDLQATVDVEQINEPSGQDLAVPVSMDGSGSMSWNDPNTLRRDGAQAFFDELDREGIPFESGIFEFPGGSTSPNFANTSVLQDFTDDVDSLREAAAQVTESGGTPMYSSLAELLTYSEAERPASNYEKAIVLFADGRPDDIALRDSVCRDADRKDSPIFGIGLGPASDLSDNPSSEAVAEMRNISSCTNGAYQGLVQDSLEVFTTAFRAVATGSSKGSASLRVQVEAGLSELNAGDIVKGTLRVTSGGETAAGDFRFRVPGASSTQSSFEFPQSN